MERNSQVKSGEGQGTCVVVPNTDPVSDKKKSASNLITSKPNPVSAGDGVVVLQGIAEEPSVVQGSKIGHLSKDEQGMVSVSAKEETMEEVPWQEVVEVSAPEQTVFIAEQQVRDRVVGKNIDEVEILLENMVRKKEILEFRIVPLGASVTMDLVPGRATAFVNPQNLIVSLDLG